MVIKHVLVFSFCYFSYFFYIIFWGKGFSSTSYHHLKLSTFEKTLRTIWDGEGGGGGELCDAVPQPSYEGRRWMINQVEEADDKSFAVKHQLDAGGGWGPEHCTPVHHVAIIVPYQDVDGGAILKKFVEYMHPFLQMQFISYKIYIVEQVDAVPYNEGMLGNVGYKMAVQEDKDVDCFIFHYVDIIPENVYNIYGCSRNPRHMSAVINTDRYTLLYPERFNGAIAITREDFETVNGFSNVGDEMRIRLKNKGIDFVRLSPTIASYKSLTTTRRTGWGEKGKIQQSEKVQDADNDGLNSLNFKVVNHIAAPLYTLIQVRF